MNKNRNRIISSATREFAKEARQLPGFRVFDFLHGYVYIRWPYLYISIGKGEHRYSPFLDKLSGIFARIFMPLLSHNGSESKSNSKTFAESYHGKVVPLEAAKQLVTVREDIRLENLEQIIPFSQARDIVLKNPQHIIALECPCRAAKHDACQPSDVCLIIGEPFTSFVDQHHPHRSRWIDSTEAIEILRAEEERGHVHHAFFKDAMLGRFYAICNCCACCCGAMRAHQHGTPMLITSSYVSSVDQDFCIACGDCSDFCQFSAIKVDNGCAIVDEALCMGCGVCATHCEQEAITLFHDPSRGEPLEIQKLVKMIN
jgi:Pyruvate/2-oxoacid:ferredoxin oxidoreductase delta subunit